MVEAFRRGLDITPGAQIGQPDGKALLCVNISLDLRCDPKNWAIEAHLRVVQLELSGQSGNAVRIAPRAGRSTDGAFACSSMSSSSRR